MKNSYDILVCGAGMAGIGAAIAAARDGADVLLVEQTEVLGGLGASGGVGNFSAAQGGHKGQGRIYQDVIDRLRRYKAICQENGWPVRHNEKLKCENMMFDHQVLPIALRELCDEAGVDLIHATTVVGARTHERAIHAAVLHNRSLRTEVKAKIFIDSSGEGILAQYAGAKTLPDDPTFPGVIKPSFMVFLRKVDNPELQPLPEKRVFADDEKIDYSLWQEPNGKIGLKLKLFHMDLDTGCGEGYNKAVMEMRARIPEFVRHFQENRDPSYVFDYASPMLGLREGRRIEGDHVLMLDEVRVPTTFEDAVAYGTFTVDANGTREILPPYQIPYRSLVPRALDNCLLAGRCLSADRLTLSSARVMPTCCMMGQAAGIAAAIAADAGTSVRSVDTEQIRARILRDTPDPDLVRERLSCP